MNGEQQIDYDFAVLRVVPRVHLGAFVNVGVVLHARTEEHLALRVLTDVTDLRSSEAICAGDAAAGPVALAPPSERFHWLTAPRSDVIQSSPVHEGVCTDLTQELDRLYSDYVRL
jgi:hypothetical protein